MTTAALRIQRAASLTLAHAHDSTTCIGDLAVNTKTNGASRSMLPAESRARDCWDWITPRQVRQLAHAAFEMACRQASQPEIDPPDPAEYPEFHTGRSVVAADMVDLFSMLIAEHAKRAGVANICTESERLKKWTEIPDSKGILKLSYSTRYTSARIYHRPTSPRVIGPATRT